MIRSSRRSIILRLRTPALDAWPDQSSGLSTLRERRWAWTGRAIEVVVVGRGPVRLRAAERVLTGWTRAPAVDACGDTHK